MKEMKVRTLVTGRSEEEKEISRQILVKYLKSV